MEAYDWPGNVRELVNTLEMVLTLTVDEPKSLCPPSAHGDKGQRGKGQAETSGA